MPNLRPTCPTARIYPAISTSDAFAEKSLMFIYGPFGINNTCTGACGSISRKAKAYLSSKTLSQGISPLRILAKMFCLS